MRRLSTPLCLCAFVAVAALGAGCGEGGAANGATVHVYVAAPLCGESQRKLKQEGGVEDLRVRLVCLPQVESGGRVDLAQAGANARRATEDSTAVAYLEAPGPGAKFSHPILESADIAWLETSSGSTAMRRVLSALKEAGSSSPRDAVRESLSGQ